MRLSRAALAVLMLGLAGPAWGVGLELIIEGREAEVSGRREAALTAYSEAVKAADLFDTQRAYAYSRMGSIRAYLGDNIKAIDDYSKAIQLNPKLGSAYTLRGYLRAAIGQYEAAEKDQQTALKQTKDQRPDYIPWVLQHYADLWRRRGDFERALEYCARADRAGRRIEVTFRRAWIYLDMGKTEEARIEFRKFMQDARGEDLKTYWPDERGAISRLRELQKVEEP